MGTHSTSSLSSGETWGKAKSRMRKFIEGGNHWILKRQQIEVRCSRLTLLNIPKLFSGETWGVAKSGMEKFIEGGNKWILKGKQTEVRCRRLTLLKIPTPVFWRRK